jgi:hypothetical protein
MSEPNIHSYCVEGERFAVRFKFQCIYCKHHDDFGACPNEKDIMESVNCKKFVERK